MKSKQFNIERRGFNFVVKPGHKETRLTFEQAHILANFLKNNMNLFACYFEEVKRYIRFLEKPASYFSYDEETGNYRTWFRPSLYGAEKSVEIFKNIFSEKGMELDFYDMTTCAVYCKNKEFFKKACEKFYNVVVIDRKSVV